MKLIKIVVACLLVLSLNSCFLFQRGYVDEQGHYVPKNPNFKLKDKAGFKLPDELDTLSIYKLTEMFSAGEKVYPLDELSVEQEYSFIKELNSAQYFLKFYSKGRCVHVTIPKEDELGQIRALAQQDISFDNPKVHKNYYFSDGIGLQIESFTLGDGYGAYVIIDYSLSSDGRVLNSLQYNTTKIYQKVELPMGLKFQAVDW